MVASVEGVRFALALLALIVAPTLSSSVSAAFLPIEHSPRVGSAAPAGLRGTPVRLGVVSVLVGLRQAPLAASGLTGVGARSPSARRQLSAIVREQALAESEVAAKIPRARVTAHHSLLLNAIAIELPAWETSRLARLTSAETIYPSLTYTLLVDRGRAVIGADALEATSGATGAGVKIAIVDDGVDVSHPMFAPAGFAYPAGFPKGAKAHVSPKVIVARSFPLDGAGTAARQVFDPRVSFHGTHVAGTAAGVEATARAGASHPRVAKIRGVAPGAYVGNYRVFTTPTPLGNVATTEQILAAFEAAVADGMNVINFSGGSPEVNPASDALAAAIANATRAGVTVVVAAGNSGDVLGAGSISSPAVADDAIAVGAVTSTRVFHPALSSIDAVVDQLNGIPYATPFGIGLPARLTRKPVRTRAVESIVGERGTPVRAELCSPRGHPNDRASELPARSLRGRVAIVARGICTIASKVERARRAGAVGVILVDNRPGEASAPTVSTSLPLLVVSDADGAGLLDAAASNGGSLKLRLGRGVAALAPERDGVVAAFSSQGPTAFRHQLKPDVSAPGVSILSASNARATGSRFDVLSGTSMAAPHVAGAVALLLELHPTWVPWQLKSALLSTAAPAWADTARTREAPPSLAGAGRAAVDRATTPLVFSIPQSVSLGDLYVSEQRPATHITTVAVGDAGGGAGLWGVSIDIFERPDGVTIKADPTASVPPGDAVNITLSVEAPAGAASGAIQAHIVLTRATETRTIPLYGFVTNPKLDEVAPTALRRHGRGTTAATPSRVEAYNFPAAPFGAPATPGSSPLHEVGGEQLFWFDLPASAVNAGVAVVPTRAGVAIDPFILGAPDENAVLGLAATPVTANGLLASRGLRDGAAALLFPPAGRYWVAVDSGLDPATRTSLAGSYRIHRWVDDLAPPRLELITRRLTRGKGTIAVRALDAKSGVDPLTLTLSYNGLELSASAFDYETGVTLFRIPATLPRLQDGANTVLIRASDHQEAKNIVATSTGFLTNTTELKTRIVVVSSRPHVVWLTPARGRCVRAGEPLNLVVTAASPEPIRAVRFSAGGRPVGRDRRPRFGDVFETTWTVPADARGRIGLLADAIGAEGAVQRRATRVRICPAGS